MVSPIRNITGKVHGKLIKLDRDLGLPEGESVIVRIERASDQDAFASSQVGDGLRKSAGSWAEDGDALDRFIDDIYRARHDQRMEPGE